MSYFENASSTVPTTGTLRTTSRVIWALMLRETKTLYGHTSLGFLWAFIEPILAIAPMWVLLAAFGRERTLPAGLSIPLFILTGEGTWLVFSTTFSKVLSSFKGNKALLCYPQVSTLDIVLARSFTSGLCSVTLYTVLIGGLYLLPYEVHLYSIGDYLTGLFLGWLNGLGYGFIAATAAVLKPSIEKLMSYTTRTLLILSGVFFSADMLPKFVRDILLFNPIFHAVEISRSSFYPYYSHVELSRTYPLLTGCVMIFIGLVLNQIIQKNVENI